MTNYAPMIETSDSDDEYESEEQEPGCFTGFINKIGKEPDSKDDDSKAHIYFQCVTAAVILAATISMALEVGSGESTGWVVFNSIVLLYFCFELFVRFWIKGCRGFWSCADPDCGWNYFDFIIVFTCIVDTWLVPLGKQFFMPAGHSAKKESNGLQILQIFRTFRILRMLRVLRLFKVFKELTNIVNGLIEAMGTVFWIAVLMVMFMLIFAIVMTDVCGNQARLAEKEGDLFFNDKEDVLKYWGSVTRSMVTWFQVLTLDDWANIMNMVYAELPIMWFVFFVYIFLMGFAMLSLLTGVVAEYMSTVSTDSKDEEKKTDDKDLANFLDQEMRKIEKSMRKRKSSDAFTPTAEQGLTLEEFKKFLKSEKVRAKLNDLDSMLKRHEVEEFFECLDTDCNGQVSHEEIKQGFLRLRGEMQPKDLLRIRYAADRVARKMQGGDGEAATTRKLDEVNHDLQEVEEKLTQMQKNIGDFLKSQTTGWPMSPVAMDGLKKLRRSGCC